MSSIELLARAKADGKTYLTEVEAKQVLEAVGIPTTSARLATTEAEAAAMSDEIGYPVVLKIMSEDIIHKSDIGGVKLNLQSEENVRQAYQDIMTAVREKQPEAKVDGVSVQKMARPGTEVIIGVTRDPKFGPAIMFGIGGVLVEVMKDVAFRLVPVNRRDVNSMVKEIKGYPLLTGYRGSEPADLEALENLLLKVSDFALSHPEIKEMDLNPVYAYSDGVLAVDARIILG